VAAEPTGPPEVEIIEVGVERLDDIGSLWRAMHDNDSEVVGEAREVTPLRSSQSSWRRRRVEFESWIRAGEGHLLIAEHDGSPAGFAFYRICRGDLSFETDERMGELEALSVEPDLRRWGLGSLLMEAVEERLAAAGIEFMGLAIISGNADALRFYERWGIVPSHVRCLGRILPGNDPAEAD
jgi:GNAT superfamily N-acetyltransferase